MDPPYPARRGRLRLEHLSRAEGKADSEARFWDVVEDAIRCSGYSERFDLRVIDVSDYGD